MNRGPNWPEIARMWLFLAAFRNRCHNIQDIRCISRPSEGLSARGGLTVTHLQSLQTRGGLSLS